MKTILILLFLHFAIFSFAQQTISGKVVTDSGEPLPVVNVFIENTYDDASSDGEGNFTDLFV